MLKHAFLFLPLLALASVACAANDEPSDDLDIDEGAQDLSAACMLGPRCAIAQLLTARTFIDKAAPNVTRSDLLVTTPQVPTRTPKIFARKTSGELRYTGGRVTLSGSTAGDAEVVVDDLLLIEVLAIDGRLLSVVTARPAEADLRINGNQVESVGPFVPWAGINRGFRYAPKSIDLTHVMPLDTPFRIRISALDYGGVALVSDVFLHHEAATTPPPPPPPPPPLADPFAADACTGAPLTYQDALRRFGPGQSQALLGSVTTVASRQRLCQVTTGCQAWQPSNDIVFGLSTRNATVRLPLVSSKLLMRAGKTTIDLEASVTVSEGASFHLDAQIREGGASFSDQGGTLTGTGLIQSRFGVAMRASCGTLVVLQTERLDSARRIEHQTVLLARY